MMEPGVTMVKDLVSRGVQCTIHAGDGVKLMIDVMTKMNQTDDMNLISEIIPNTLHRIITFIDY
jgi:hypothetical protein